MTRKEMLDLHKALSLIEGRQFTVKFSYFVAKNKVLLKEEVAALQEAQRPSKEYAEYDRKRAELAHKLADRDENNQPKIENNNFIIIERVEEFKKELDQLKEEYAEVIQAHQDKVDEFERMLNEPFKYKGPKIDLKDVPETVEPSVLETLIMADLIIE